ncbi:MAG: hypothetical protein JW854_08660 [Actinobacteria bacterium]|nr:hypothetical protein [Actinomycetota bacterium]
MSRFSYWYSGLSRKGKIAITAGGITAAVIVAIVILYLVFKPTMVEVRYGEIIWDPIDGHVWEENTQTKMVEASEAGDYRVTYIERLSPEHEERLRQEQEKLAQEAAELENATGFESMETSFPTDTIAQLNTMQQNIEVMGQDIITGMEMANQLYEAQLALMDYRSQASSYPLPPELEPLRAQAIQVLDMYISACDLYIDAIASGDLTLVDQANALIQEASSMIQSLLPTY